MNYRLRGSLLARALAASGMVSPLLANTYAPKSLAQVYGEARIVVAARVTDAVEQTADGKVCGTKYRAIKVNVLKGRELEGAKEIKFGASKGLVVGSEYLLFLKDLPDPEVIYDWWVSQTGQKPPMTKEEALRKISCGGLAPGLGFDPNAAWQIEERGVRIVGLLPRPLPDSIHIDHQGRSIEWFLRAEDLFKYLRSLDAKPGNRAP